MSRTSRAAVALLAVVAVMAGSGGTASAQTVATNDLPNPYRTVENYAKMPTGRTWGATSAVDIDRDGRSIWVAERCGTNTCAGSDLDPILKFDASGNLVTSFGAGMFIFPHGIHVDSVGNIWVTDAQGPGGNNPDRDGKGHQVIKFSPEGEVLLTLGTAGVAGDGTDGLLNTPCDVITAPNGDIFVADGHSGQNATTAPPGSTGRIMKFSPDGEFIMEWGRIGNGPGEFRTPHAMAFDSQGRLFVADRGNHRIQIFDQDGNYIDEYYEYSRISDLFITSDDVLYAIDSETGEERHPGWMTGIRIGSALEDRVTAFIPPHHSDDRPMGVAGEGVAVDADGNVYAAEGPGSRPWAGGGLTKYVLGM